MAQTETRHAEKSKLFSLYDVKHGGNVDLQIAHTEASMEPADVEEVKERFSQWLKDKSATD
jgi:hypothetical protein